MTPQRVKELTALMPQHQKELDGDIFPLVQAESWNMTRPEFGWLFCEDLVCYDLPLPDGVQEPYLRIAYLHLAEIESSDDIRFARTRAMPCISPCTWDLARTSNNTNAFSPSSNTKARRRRTCADQPQEGEGVCPGDGKRPGPQVHPGW